LTNLPKPKKESAKQRGGLVVPATGSVIANQTTQQKKQKRANMDGSFAWLFHPAKGW